MHYPKSALFLGAGPSQGFLQQPQVGSQGPACTTPRVAIPAQPALWRRFTDEESRLSYKMQYTERLQILRTGLPVDGPHTEPGYITKRAFAPSQARRSSENGTVFSSFPRFACVLVRSPNQKRFFSVFKVSLNIMRQSDLASPDVEFRKSDKKLHLSSVWSFFLRSIVHSSLIILILLFDRILGLPFALKAEMSSEHVLDPNLSTGYQGC